MNNCNGILQLARSEDKIGIIAREELLDMQVQNLLNKGITELASITKDKFLQMVLPLRNGVHLFNGNISENSIPVLLVLGTKFLPACKMLSMVEYDGNLGFSTGIKFEKTKSLLHYFNEKGDKMPEPLVYIIFSVEDGRDLTGIAPEKALKKNYILQSVRQNPVGLSRSTNVMLSYTPERNKDQIQFLVLESKGRNPLDLARGINLAIHFPEKLVGHNIDLSNSFIYQGDKRFCPYLTLADGNQPQIGLRNIKEPRDNFGAGSASEFIYVV